MDWILGLLMEDDDFHVDRLEERQRLDHLQDTADPFSMDEKLFVKLFRLPPSGAFNMIETLSARCPALHEGDIPVHIKVLCALNFYGQGCYQTPVGQGRHINLAQPTVSNCLKAVTNAIVDHLLPYHIKFGGTPEERTVTKQGFQNLGFPNVIGAIDGTHIAIVAPIDTPEAPKKLYFNRKGYYSINAQITCDAKGQVLHVNPNFPGSTHDSAVWAASNLNNLLKVEYIAGERNQWLLGDKGYTLVPWLMTPYNNPPADSAAMRFNKAHAKARNVVEMCFGKIKNRFRCLLKHRTLHYQPEKAAKILLACCTLHNMFLGHWTDDLMTEELQHETANLETAELDVDFSREGLATRECITNEYFN